MNTKRYDLNRRDFFTESDKWRCSYHPKPESLWNSRYSTCSFFFNLFILTYETISLKFYLRHSRHVREIHRDRSDFVGKTGNKKFTAASHICSYISPTIFVKNFGIYSLNRGIYCDSVKEVDIALQLNFPERQSPWTSFYHTSSNCKRFHCHTTLRIRIPSYVFPHFKLFPPHVTHYKLPSHTQTHTHTHTDTHTHTNSPLPELYNTLLLFTFPKSKHI
jgi:hypothetical protein